MEETLKDVWTKVWRAGSDINDLIRFAEEGRSKAGDSQQLENELNAYVDNVKLVIEQLKADGF